MRFIGSGALFLSVTLLFIGCNSSQPVQTTTTQPYPNDAEEIQTEGDEYWAKDNFDLQRAGEYLQRSNSPEEFERFINEDDGINNLDLNGDGYVDYVSVEEFDDRDSNSRGLSLFSRFGPNLIQEIATVLLYRDRPDYPGARFLIRGNDDIYGDNSYYETNWLDRSVGIASYLFKDHDPYRSPYYYDNYPTWYSPYEFVETPVYRTRIEQMFPQPTFAYTQAAPVYFEKIKIKSPNNGLHLGQIHAKLVKPTKEQEEFWKNNPGRKIGKLDQGRDDHPGRDNPPRSDRGDERGNPARDDRGAERGNPNKPEKMDNPGGGNPHKGGNPNPHGGNPNAGGDNPNKGGNPNAGGNPNKGGGNPHGGGNPNKGGGKKP